jgi:hypothetical protein
MQAKAFFGRVGSDRIDTVRKLVRRRLSPG